MNVNHDLSRSCVDKAAPDQILFRSNRALKSRKLEQNSRKQRRSSLYLAITLFGCLTMSGTVLLNAQSRLLLVTQRDHTLHIYAPETLEEIASVKEDEDAGHEITTTADGKTAFVPIYGDSGVGSAGSDGSHIQIFDVATAKAIGEIRFPRGVRPHKPIWDPHTGLLLVTTELDRSISVIDPSSRKLIGTIPTGAEQSHMITLLPDGQKLYSANVNPGSVSVMNVAARKLLKVIPISRSIQRISCTNDGALVFTADQKVPELVVIDTKVDEITKRITLPGIGYGTAPTPDGKWLLVAIPKKDVVALVDLQKFEVTRTIPSVSGINEFAVSADSKTAWASSPYTNQLVKLDLVQGSTVKVVPTGKFPDGLWLTNVSAAHHR